MDKHVWVPLFLHWFWVAFFVVFGIYHMFKPGALGCAKPFRVAEDAGRERIDAALLRRNSVERVPHYVSVYLGVVSVILGVIAAFTPIQPALLYGILCLELATVNAVAYLHFKTVQSKRVAILTPRTAGAVIPPYWFALSVVGAVALLVFTSRPDFAISAIVVCISALLTTAVAWRLTLLPALLSGEDLPAEQAVDDRVRATRSTNALMLALIQPFVFCTQVLERDTTAQSAVFFLELALWIAFSVWVVRKQSKRLTLVNA